MGTETEGFAEVLRGLKERSGLSYGALAKRAHLSTSTLHRYCKGDAVPTEFAPVERLARLCGATRDETVALHRRWIVADDARRRGRAPAAGESAAGAAAVPGDGPGEKKAGDGTEEGPGEGRGAEPEAVLPPPAAEEVRSRRSRRRVRLVGAAAAVVVLAASTALAIGRDPEAPKDGDAAAGPAGRPAATVPARHPSGSASPSVSQGTGPRPGASAVPSPSAPAAGTAAPPVAASPGAAAPARRSGAVPLSVDVRPYTWLDPCGQVYVVDRPPTQVPPPPSEQDARGWVTALGGAPGGDMLMELAFQGTGEEAVVLHDLHVRVVGKEEPLPWNAYTMGVGCGGDMTPQSFDVNLDVARPRAVPVAGRQGDREIPAGDFPYKVSASDPQLLRVTAHTAAHAVRWYLELEWSSGGRRGTLRIDDNGRPFATSAVTGRPVYDYPLGGSGWLPHVPDEG